ncbi:MAG: PilZ domain-containing protein [Candidatus Aminicenantes bacterium]|nr:PilZ domain-containing protein [Candidatus Aminicenantes bacterium]
MTLKILALTALLSIPLFVVLWILRRFEKRRKQRIADDFRAFVHAHPVPERNMREMRRVLLPVDLDVWMHTSDENGRRVRGRLRDLSLSGAAAIISGFPRRMEPGMEVNQTIISTPLNQFCIERMRLMRIGSGPERHMAAFQFQRIDAEQFTQLQRFLGYLDRYQHHETAGH